MIALRHAPLAAFRGPVTRRQGGHGAPANTGLMLFTSLHWIVFLVCIYLRQRNIDVVLVTTPNAAWYEDLVPPRFTALVRDRLCPLAAQTGAILLSDWPSPLHDEGRYWDGHHMVAAATRSFTDELAYQLQLALTG